MEARMRCQRSRNTLSQSNVCQRIRKALDFYDGPFRLSEIGSLSPVAKGLRLRRQAQLQAPPNFEAIDCSIRPVVPGGM
jgi:hypothetical protein